MKISILGFGNVGKQFANLFSKAGHEIVIGLRSGLKPELPYAAATFKEAAVVADIVAITIPFTTCADVLPELRKDVERRLLIKFLL